MLNFYLYFKYDLLINFFLFFLVWIVNSVKGQGSPNVYTPGPAAPTGAPPTVAPTQPASPGGGGGAGGR